MSAKKRKENVREYLGPRSRQPLAAEQKSRRKIGASKIEKEKKSLQKQKQKKVEVAKRGATRAEINKERPPVRWGRFVLLPLLIVALGAGVSRIEWGDVFNRAYAATNRPLAHIKIESEFRYVSKQELQDMITGKLNGSFVDLDLRDVKLSIEKNPWIQEAMIERIWPDTLKLKIIEHTPIARWGDDGFISREGNLIKVDSNEVLNALPLLYGNDNDSAEVAKNYLLFSELLKGSGLQVSGLMLDDKLAWTITMTQGFTLVLGRGDIHGRLENFRYVFDRHLKNEKDRLEKIDMRYEKGLAVSWKSNAKTDEALIAVGAVQ